MTPAWNIHPGSGIMNNAIPCGRFAGCRIMITGGVGFIGSNLARRLVGCGAKVTLVDSLVSEYGGNLFNVSGIEDQLRINISDVRDEHSFSFLIRDQHYLFNLAGQTSHLDSMQDPYTDLEINCRAQLSILEACRKYNPDIRVIYASTRQLYGHPDYLPVDEKHLLRPADVNGINKMAGEHYHILYHKVYGLRACALRLTNTYGPRMRIKDARQTFLGSWIRSLLEDKPIEVWGGTQKRDFNYVDDVVDALLMAIACEDAVGQVFNLGGMEVITLQELARMMVEQYGSGSYDNCFFPPERKRIDIGDYYADFSLAQKALDWHPRIGLAEGLARTLDFFRADWKHYI